MKTASLTASIFLAFLVFSSSCTIQKRVHLPGYHVERHQKKKQQNSGDHLTKISEKRTSSVLEQEVVAVYCDTVTPLVNAERKSIQPIIKEARSPMVPGGEDQQNSEQQKPELKNPRENQSQAGLRDDPFGSREFNRWGLTGILLVGVSLIATFGLFATLPALISCIRGLVQTDREPMRYKGRKLYVVGIIISAILFSFFLRALLSGFYFSF